jgi:hypothetical protein
VSFIDKGIVTYSSLNDSETAKQNDSWTTLDEVEELKISKNLA